MRLSLESLERRTVLAAVVAGPYGEVKVSLDGTIEATDGASSREAFSEAVR
jgi:hypothetical protein